MFCLFFSNVVGIWTQSQTTTTLFLIESTWVLSLTSHFLISFIFPLLLSFYSTTSSFLSIFFLSILFLAGQYVSWRRGFDRTKWGHICGWFFAQQKKRIWRTNLPRRQPLRRVTPLFLVFLAVLYLFIFCYVRIPFMWLIDVATNAHLHKNFTHLYFTNQGVSTWYAAWGRFDVSAKWRTLSSGV